MSPHTLRQRSALSLPSDLKSIAGRHARSREIVSRAERLRILAADPVRGRGGTGLVRKQLARSYGL